MINSAAMNIGVHVSLSDLVSSFAVFLPLQSLSVLNCGTESWDSLTSSNIDIAKSQACIISHNVGHGLNVYIPFHMFVLFCLVYIILWDWNGQGLAVLSTKNISDIL